MRPGRAAAACALLGLMGVAAMAGRAVVERVTQDVRRSLARAGMSADAIHVSWLGPARLERVVASGPGGARVTVDAVAVDWSLRGGHDPRAHVKGLALAGLRVRRGPLEIAVPALDLEVQDWQRQASGQRIRLLQPAGSGAVEVHTAGGRQVTVELERFDLSQVDVQWNGQPLMRPGRWSGRIEVGQPEGGLQTRGAVAVDGARVSLASVLGPEEAGLGAPTDLDLAWSARRGPGEVTVEHLAARASGLRVMGNGRLRAERGGRLLDATFSAEAELAGALRTAGLRIPEPLDGGPVSRLGTASLDVTLRGDLDRPASLRIVPRLQFASAPEAVAALQFLRRPFRHEVEPAGRLIHVSAGASGFVPLGAVPPAFVRMLLMAEDAGFFGHPGIDVAEIPAAWAENLERGRFKRGASTITQQLARNLFLSRDKTYGRKMEEAALALALDAAVPKARLLEIYLNVIEWGPGVYGLGPAARHYFGKAPSQLTTREMAFLVCLVPSPVRYHSAHRAGQAGPGMTQLMDNLLAKMHAAGALDDDGYAQALSDVLVFAPEEGEATARTAG